MKAKIISLALLFTSAVVAAQVGLAESKEGQEPRRKGPPPEAFAACEGRAEGEKVAFDTPRGHTLQAICKHKQGKLVAVPEGHRPKHKGEEKKDL